MPSLLVLFSGAAIPLLPGYGPACRSVGRTWGSQRPPSLSLLQHHSDHDGGGGGWGLMMVKKMWFKPHLVVLCVSLEVSYYAPRTFFFPFLFFSFSISLKAVVHIEYVTVCVCLYECVRYTQLCPWFMEVISLDKILWFAFPPPNMLLWGCDLMFSSSAPFKSSRKCQPSHPPTGYFIGKFGGGLILL